MASLPKSFLSEQEYLEIERAAEFKSEYLNGQMFQMTGGTVAHARLTMNLGFVLKTQLRGKACEAFNSDLRVRIPSRSMYTYPDLSAARGPKFADDQSDTLINPVLIIEVLSASTRDDDRGGKLRQYQTIPSFIEYLLVDQYAVNIEHWLKQSDGSWLVREVRGLDAEVGLNSVDCRFALRDVYEGVDLGPAELSY